jgi:hypothetical protein
MAEDGLKDVRKVLMSICAQEKLHLALVAHCEQRSDKPPFSQERVNHARNKIAKLLQVQPEAASTVAQNQPFHLHLMHAAATRLQDVDAKLTEVLQEGVPTGCLEPIQYSGVFFPSDAGPNFDADAAFMECEGNWAKSESDASTTATLIAEDIAQGFVHRIVGGEAAAHKRWPHAVAIGKLNLAISDGRKPRLVLDSTVPNVNKRVALYEKVENPSLMSIKRGMTGMRGITDFVGFSLDVKAAHKRVRVCDREQGLLRFRHGGELSG